MVFMFYRWSSCKYSVTVTVTVFHSKSLIVIVIMFPILQLSDEFWKAFEIQQLSVLSGSMYCLSTEGMHLSSTVALTTAPTLIVMATGCLSEDLTKSREAGCTAMLLPQCA
jgi:hypothetical protein